MNGVFGQATWHATSKLDLTAGMRETNDSLVRRRTFVAGPSPRCVAPVDCVGLPNSGSESDSKLTYRANVAWHFTPKRMVYATVASGFKGGGFNNFCGSGPYKPEELVSYELGFKGRPTDNFEIDSDLFYYDYSSQQIRQLNNVNGALVIFTNTFPAVIEGLENSITYRPTSADELRLDIVNLRSHYKRLDTCLPSNTGPIGAPVNLAGHTMNATPTIAATLGYFHSFMIGNGASIRVHADVKFSKCQRALHQPGWEVLRRDLHPQYREQAADHGAGGQRWHGLSGARRADRRGHRPENGGSRSGCRFEPATSPAVRADLLDTFGG